MGRMATTPGGTPPARPRRRCSRSASTPARRLGGAAHAVSSHLRDVLDKIAVEEQPMSPLTDDAGVEEEKNEDSPERQLASPGASRRVSMASPVVSPAPAPAPRRRGTLGLDGNTPVKPPPQTEIPRGPARGHVQIAGQREEEDVSRTFTRRADASISVRAARRAGPAATTSPRWVGSDAILTALFSVGLCAQEDCRERRVRRCGRGRTQIRSRRSR